MDFWTSCGLDPLTPIFYYQKTKVVTLLHDSVFTKNLYNSTLEEYPNPNHFYNLHLKYVHRRRIIWDGSYRRMRHWWRRSLCCSTWDEGCRSLTTVGRWWNGTYGGRGGNGDGWQRSWEGRYQIKEWLGGSMCRLSKWCWCLGPRQGYWPPGWRVPSRGFTTGRHSGWRAWSPIISRTGHECTHQSGWLWWCRDYRRLGYISPAARSRLHSTFQPVLSWTCVWRSSGIWECAYPGNCGSSLPWISWKSEREGTHVGEGGDGGG